MDRVVITACPDCRAAVSVVAAAEGGTMLWDAMRQRKHRCPPNLRIVTPFVVRCRYVQPDGVGYLDREGRCTREGRDAQTFDNEADAWTFANASGERVPDDCWVETR